jgi:hypothetical protein
MISEIWQYILPKTNHNADINLEMIPESVQAVQKISSILATDLKKEQSETEKYERLIYLSYCLIIFFIQDIKII